MKIIWKQISRKNLKNSIRKKKAEEVALKGLMKKAQEERFKKNKLSGLVYNIRMEKYEEKLNQIKEELPVLEKRLKGKKGKSTKN